MFVVLMDDALQITNNHCLPGGNHCKQIRAGDRDQKADREIKVEIIVSCLCVSF